MQRIYTCTMNPAIDLFIATKQLQMNTVNRTLHDDIQANGKGVNVSLVLKMLGIENTAFGFSAGFTGKYIEDFLKKKGVDNQFIHVDGKTRINVFAQVLEDDCEYKLVNKGPFIPKNAIETLLEQIRQLNKGDFLCISGSLPKGVSEEILLEISKITHEKGVHLLLDSSSPIILDCLPYQPFLLKPNEEELAHWFGEEMISFEEYPFYLEQLLSCGAENILLSLGEKGGVYANPKQMLYANAPKGEVVNTACAGDTLLATFLKGIVCQENLAETLKTAIAAGSSTSFSQGLTDFHDVEKLKQQVTVRDFSVLQKEKSEWGV
ncbi:1-phosphofructokinase [Pilibacter termitis]|uniref:Tagatose-6-phosphate kinase n=1 Tax=Pilibacter termitis TaxID=263852 RepID=A0A1T4PBE7_9ENTE|nr:1-phosphofructokinase [Pilibacter termitis]SJZ88883.1 1-phosphofructokinase [Pilibacter termitis]